MQFLRNHCAVAPGALVEERETSVALVRWQNSAARLNLAATPEANMVRQGR